MIKLVLKIAFTFGILAYLYHKQIVSLIVLETVFGSKTVLLSGAGMILLASFVSYLRWYYILNAYGIRAPWKDFFQVCFVGTFFNLALPGAVTGDLLKGYYLAKNNGAKRKTLIESLVLDRIYGALGLVVISALSFLLFSHSMEHALSSLIYMRAILFSFVALGSVALLMTPWVEKKVSRRLNAQGFLGKVFFPLLRFVLRVRATFWIGLVSSLVVHGLILGLIYTASFHDARFSQIPWEAYGMVVPLGLLVTAVPISPAGLGTGHGAFYILFRQLGYGGAGDIYSYLVIFQMMVGLIGACIYMTVFRSKSKKSVESSHPKWERQPVNSLP